MTSAGSAAESTVPTVHLPILRSVAELRAAVAAWRRNGDTVGFVPTMGALHEGHITLVRKAQHACKRAIVSIFVNPKQFGPREDFTSYPRQEMADAMALTRAGCDLLYAPAVGEMYPEGFRSTVSVAGLSEGLCGAHRPGHFEGVATVVTKLLLQVGADAAYFGEKDYQQLQIIKRMARDLDIPTRIVGVPTVREHDGLAMSSRNVRLTPHERRVAPAMYRVLSECADVLGSGARPAEVVELGCRKLAEAGFRRIEYFELRPDGLEGPLDLDTPVRAQARLLTAAHLGSVRLIDNVAVTPQ